jgi:hypothetical protein
MLKDVRESQTSLCHGLETIDFIMGDSGYMDTLESMSSGNTSLLNQMWNSGGSDHNCELIPKCLIVAWNTGIKLFGLENIY